MAWPSGCAVVNGVPGGSVVVVVIAASVIWVVVVTSVVVVPPGAESTDTVVVVVLVDGVDATVLVVVVVLPDRMDPQPDRTTSEVTRDVSSRWLFSSRTQTLPRYWQQHDYSSTQNPMPDVKHGSSCHSKLNSTSSGMSARPSAVSRQYSPGGSPGMTTNSKISSPVSPI